MVLKGLQAYAHLCPSLSSIRCWFSCRPARRNRTLPRPPFQSPSVSSCGGSQGVMNSWQLSVGPSASDLISVFSCFLLGQTQCCRNYQPKTLILQPLPAITVSPLVCPDFTNADKFYHVSRGLLAGGRDSGQARPQGLVVRTEGPRAEPG